MSKVNPALIPVKIIRIDLQYGQFGSGRGTPGYLYGSHQWEFGIADIKSTTLGMIHANSTMSATILSKMGRMMKILMPEMTRGADIYIFVGEGQGCR